MWLELAATAAVLLPVLFYLWATRDYGYWEKRGLPSVKPEFPFGSIGDAVLSRKTTGEVFQDIYRSHPEESAVGYFILGEPAVLLRDPELIKQVLVKDFNSFHDNSFWVDIRVDPLFGINPFTTRGPLWKSIRAIHTPTHTVSKLKLMVKEMVEVGQNMIEHIRVNKNKEIEAKELAGVFTIDVVARCGYGFGGNSFDETEGRGFRSATRGQVFTPGPASNLAQICSIFSPRAHQLLRLRLLSKDLENFFLGMVRRARDFRRESGVKRADLLQQLLDAKDPGNAENPAFTDLEIAGHCVTLFLNGNETSSLVLGFLLYELARNEEVQKKLREEISTSIESLESITYDQIHSLQYLDMVLSETLRMYPPVPYLGRRCTAEAAELRDGRGRSWSLRRGQVVTVPVLALHRDPERFPRPEEFDPERFSGPRDDKFAYLPFGEGPRICIGMRFGMTQIKVAVVAILKDFLIVTEDKERGAVKPNPMVTFIYSPKELLIKFLEI